MKKVIMTAAFAIASYAAANAQANANSNNLNTADSVTVTSSIIVSDMIDLVPEAQMTTTVTMNTWDEFNGYVTLNETGTQPSYSFILPNVLELDDIDFRVSASRHFTVSVKGNDFTRAAGSYPSQSIATFSPSDFILAGGTSQINNSQWQNSFGNLGGATLPSTMTALVKGSGGYNKHFTVVMALKPEAAYNHAGTYTGVTNFVATLNP